MTIGATYPLAVAAPYWTCQDQTTYTLGGGVCSGSRIGRVLADNDRMTYARMRRHQTQAFSLTGPDQIIAGVQGTDLGVWDLPPTDGVQAAEWVLLCEIEYDGAGGETVHACPYTVGAGVRGEDGGWLRRTDYPMVGIVSPWTPTIDAQAYTISARANAQIGRYGLALYSEINTTATYAASADDTVQMIQPGLIHINNPVAGMATGAWAIRLTDGIAGAGISMWWDILSITIVGVSATVHVYDPSGILTGPMPVTLSGVVAWEARKVSTCTIRSLQLREMPRTVSL
jgi:hypothetical protein